MAASPPRRSPAPSPLGSPRRPQSTGVLATGGGDRAGWEAYHAPIAGESSGPAASVGGMELPSEGGLISVDDLLRVRLDLRKEEKGPGKELKPRDRDQSAGMWTRSLMAGEDGAPGSPCGSAGQSHDESLVLQPPSVLEGVASQDTDGGPRLWGCRCARCSTVNGLSQREGRMLCWDCGQASIVHLSGQDQRASWSSPEMSILPPSQACPETGAELSVAQWRQRLARYCAARAPERVPGAQLDQLLRRWAGAEGQLWQELRKLHGPEPTATEGAAALRTLRRRRPQPQPQPEAAERSRSGRLSAGSGDLVMYAIELPEHSSLGCDLRGIDGSIVITGVTPGSAAAKAGLAVQAVLTACDCRQIKTISDVRAALAHARAQGQRHVVFGVTGPQAYRKPSDGDSAACTATPPVAPSTPPAPQPGRGLRCGCCDAVNRVYDSDTRFVCTSCGQACNAELGVLLATDQDLPPIAPRASCRPCPDTGQELSFTEWRSRLARFYAVWAPDRVPGRQLDQILRSWAGREDDLLSGMVKRYGAEPTLEEGEQALAALLAQAQPPAEDEDAAWPQTEQQGRKRDDADKAGLRHRFMSAVMSSTRKPPNDQQPDEGVEGEVADDSPRTAATMWRSVLKNLRPDSEVRREAPRAGDLQDRSPPRRESSRQKEVPLSPLPEDDDGVGELRVDEEDGRPYSLGSFVDYYGGSTTDPPEQWLRAQRHRSAGQRPKGTTVALSEKGDIVL
eukprot:TRINITY_DN4362_c2_g1_i1.p1 TRINITY_DN4362_c2_g1~~TRINITY_DN4362_c2_g1_i1.p1  ORF type:complete len:753 (+),score=138.36 TRINITY_DN4362_c2_g1_i1:56-2260(+)